MQDLRVTIDIELLRLPCEVVDIQFMARKGREHQITRQHATENGYVQMTQPRPFEDIEASLKKKEGCKLTGTFYKHLAMNSFYIVIANPPLLAQLLMRNPEFRFDLSHKINYLYLGESNQHGYYEREYKINGFNKLQDTVRWQDKHPDGSRDIVKHTYYIQAIPTLFDGVIGSTEIFQYTASEYSKEGAESGIIFM